MKEEASDQELFAEIKNGDHGAFRALFKRYFNRVCAFVMSIVRSQDLAVDIVQQVFVKLWEKRENLFIVKSVSSYLLTSAKNESYNQIKASNTRIRYETDYIEESFQAYEHFNDQESLDFGRLVNDAIQQLPNKCQQIYRLAKEDGLTYSEIAGFLEVSEKTVENQMGIALKKLREILKPQLSDFMMA